MSSQMMQEIETQAQAWKAALRATDRAADALREILSDSPAVRFLGAGSSYYLGNAAVRAWAGSGFHVEAVPASEPLLHPSLYPWAGRAAIAVSRSGSTSETLAALRGAKEAGAPCVTITTVEGSPMAQVADLTLVLSDAAEQATVQTRSFSGQLLAAVLIGVHMANDTETLSAARSLPDLAAGVLERSREAVERVGTSWQRVYFLGTGAHLGLAQEGALKMKETALTEAEAFQTLEFRHGPMSMVDADTLIVAIVSDESRDHELKVLEEMRDLGGEILAIGESDPRLDGIVAVELASGVPERVRLPLSLPTLHYLAHAKALSKGIEPDHPRNLSFAVELEGL